MKKVALVCGPGGHLTEMLLLRDAYIDNPHFFITFRRGNTENLENAYLLPYHPHLYSLRAIIPTILLYFRMLKVLLKERPNVIVSTGGGAIALPAFLFGKIMGTRLIYIEHIGRFESPSGLGKQLYFLADRFFVQNPGLLKCYGAKAEYHGGVL